MGKWQGHRAVTSDKLLPILKRAAAGHEHFSHAERILYTTCEFWAAVAAQSIITYLDADILEDLRNTVVAFRSIGAANVVNSLDAALRELRNVTTQQRVLECLVALEIELADTQDPVDQLIARFAATLDSEREFTAPG